MSRDWRSFGRVRGGQRVRLLGVALEAIAIQDATRRGYVVSKPLDGQGPYDFRIDTEGGETYRVEVKAWSAKHKAKLGEKCDVLIAIAPGPVIEWTWAENIKPPKESPFWEVP